MKHVISIIVAATALGMSSAAQDRASPLRLPGEVRRATLDLATGEISRPDRGGKSLGLTLRFANTDTSGYMCHPAAHPRQEWLDWGVLPDSAGSSDIMGKYSFGYATSVVSTWLAGPGASLCTSFYDDAVGWCAESGQGLLPDVRFCYTGLPGSPDGYTPWAWVIDVELTGGSEFVQDAGPFGYSMTFFDPATGPLLCYAGGLNWDGMGPPDSNGQQDVFDLYIPDVASGVCEPYWFGGYPFNMSSWYLELYARNDIPPATCSWYCGSGVNFDGFTQAGCPRLGADWQASVVAAGSNVGAVLLGYDAPLSLMTPRGEVLVDIASPAGELLGTPIEFGNPARFDLPVPLDMGLVGFTYYVQAAGIGGNITLHCAWQNVIGS